MLNDLLKLLGYRDIRLWKMKFLFSVIQKSFEKFKYPNNLMEFWKKFQILVELDEL